MVKRHLAGLIVAAVVAGGGVAAAAPDGSSDGGAAPANRPSQEQVQKCREAHQAGQAPSDECKQLRRRAIKRRMPRPGGAIFSHAVHGDLVVKAKDGTFETVAFDKGSVLSKGDHTLTLRREDGQNVTVKVNDATTYKGVDSFDQVKTGQAAVVISKDGVARLIGQRAPGGNNAGGGNVEGDEEQVPAT
jgi:hypothetical protein